MKAIHRNRALAVVVVCAQLLSACDDEPRDERLSSTNIGGASKALQVETGDNAIATRTDDSLSVPQWVPVDFLFPDGSRIFLANSDIASAGGLLGLTIDTSRELTAQFFSDSLVNAGWSVDETGYGVGQALYSRDDARIVVSINARRHNEAHSQATLIFSNQ